jgi:membrane-bound lytic murein transglycosylase MltF
VGAIGVMQVMPKTGKELNVGNISEAEANVHAGVKYMRWMIDQNYGKEPMTKLDKALFAFASYNCGSYHRDCEETPHQDQTDASHLI